MDALLAFILRLLNDEGAREEFNVDPSAAVAAAGLSDVSRDDVDAVMPIVYDSVGVSQDRSYDTSAHVSTGASGGNFFHGGGGGKHDAAVQQISHVVNSTTVYDNDTIYDNSINQNFIATDGGLLFVEQDIDQTTANGNGAVAVGGENEGAISTGGGFTAGDDLKIDDSVLVGGDNTGGIINGDDAVVQGANSNFADRGGEIDNTTVGDGSQFADRGGEIQNVGGDYADRGGQVGDSTEYDFEDAEIEIGNTRTENSNNEESIVDSELDESAVVNNEVDQSDSILPVNLGPTTVNDLLDVKDNTVDVNVL